MAKDKDETAAPAAPVKMVNVRRLAGDAHGGPIQTSIPETSLPAWRRNGWKPVEEWTR